MIIHQHLQDSTCSKGDFPNNRSFEAREFEKPSTPSERTHVGVEPMLLALSMELALEAWLVSDCGKKFIKSHDRVRLFGKLKSGNPIY